MKLIHLSDLHLGKRLDEFPLLEDQEFILKRILNIIDEEKPDGVMIAGDVYDQRVPSASAVATFDNFLVQLARRNLKVFVISGNHDSPERIAFGSRIMDAIGIYLSPVYDGKIDPICLKDDCGEINFYLLPFIKPADVRRFGKDAERLSYNDAVRWVIDSMQIDTNKRNVLVAHQFITNATRAESEELFVGGLDNVDAEVFSAFDYVALGHLHSAQSCGSEKIRYCGTPLKYSFSEAKDHKSVTVVELREKGDLNVKTVDLIPQHDLVDLRGTYEELVRRAYYESTTWQEDYVRITLTDEEDIPEVLGKLRTVYHRLASLRYDNKRTQSNSEILVDRAVEKKTPYELFADFYELQNNQPMSDEQAAYMKQLIEQVWEGEA